MLFNFEQNSRNKETNFLTLKLSNDYKKWLQLIKAKISTAKTIGKISSKRLFNLFDATMI